MKIARISKIAGISFAGFVAATIAADKVNLGPGLAQMAGVVGGLMGTVVGQWSRRDQAHPTAPEPNDTNHPPSLNQDQS